MSEELDLAISRLKAFNHYIIHGLTHNISTDYCADVALVICAAQKAESLRAENAELKQKLDYATKSWKQAERLYLTCSKLPAVIKGEFEPETAPEAYLLKENAELKRLVDWYRETAEKEWGGT